jgi:zinc protease
MQSSRRKMLGLACAILALIAAVQTSARGQSSARPIAPTAAKPAAPTPATPTVDQIIDRYVKAIGGLEAWRKFTSRVMMGTIEVPSLNLSGTVMIHEKAPDKLLVAVIINGAAFQQGFDGKLGWTDDPKNGLRDQSGAELAEARRDADFLHSVDLQRLYKKLTVVGSEKIGDRDAYIVEASVAEGSEPTKMYFDSQTGLLLREIRQSHDADGVSELREDLDDYREVDGIKMPFTTHQTNGDTTYTMTISEVRHNVDLDDSEFAKPAAQ